MDLSEAFEDFSDDHFLPAYSVCTIFEIQETRQMLKSILFRNSSNNYFYMEVKLVLKKKPGFFVWWRNVWITLVIIDVCSFLRLKHKVIIWFLIDFRCDK